MRLSYVCTALAAFAVGVNGDRDGGIKSVGVHRDGHFQLAADLPENTEAIHDVPPPRKIKALHPVADHEVDEKLHPSVQAHRQGGWFDSKSLKKTSPAAASSFANRTDNWMTISQIASSKLETSHVQIATPQPTVPPERYKSKPKSWPASAWSSYEKAYEKLKPLREGPGHHAATVAAVFLGPDSCILKILYVFFVKEGEDDYPYVPRGCGDMFDFALDANGMHVPWLLIAGALAIVTGSHSSLNSDN